MGLMAWMIGVFEWKVRFVLMGVVGVGWGIVWMILFKENRGDDKGVNEGEVGDIGEGEGEMEERGGGEGVKWYEVLKYGKIGGMWIGFLMMNYNC